MSRASRRKRCTGGVGGDLLWICGLAEPYAPAYWQAGARGFTSGLANVAPQLALDVLASLRAGDADRTQETWLRVRRFEELRARGGSADNVAVVEEGMHQLGLCRRDVRPPGHVLGADAARAVAEAISSWAYAPFMGKTVRETFRVPAELDLAAIDPRGRPIGPRDKSAAAEEMVELADRLDHLQEALHAEALGGGPRAVLLVLQGMDTSGKGGVIRHVGGLVNPQGLQIATFKKPTEEELAHHFLWRVRKQVPLPGRIGIFDRSHYEDVLVARVDELVPEDVWRPRYTEISQFEAELAEQGVAIVKCMLHISAKEQAERLLARLDDPAKRWKYNPGDLDARAKWGAYQDAYAEALRRTDSDDHPWYVIPSDRKWYRNWAIAALLAETLAVLDPRVPRPAFDVDAERARLAASTVS